MRTLAFLINPIAGMGGSVGLKGTDGVLEEAVRRGAVPIAPERARKALSVLKESQDKFKIITPSGEMGESVLSDLEFSNFEVVHEIPEKTTANDTKRACKKFFKADLIAFCGGDGTARDIYSVVERIVPIIGIPSGVKMHSAVFGIEPKSSGVVIRNFLLDDIPLRDAEVMDIDEEKCREGRLDVKLFGYALTPYEPTLVQGRKFVYDAIDENDSKEEIARYLEELIEDDVLYILGAGTTLEHFGKSIGIEKTLLGIDLMLNKEMIAKDVSEKDILSALEKYAKARIIVSPIGMQGFIFGRGNQQLSSKVIRKVGVKNIIIVATPYKLAHTPVLRVDTDDEELDKKLKGYRRVISGYHRMTVKRVE